MAVTLDLSPADAARGNDIWGRRRIHLFEVAFDALYPTGGEVLGLAAAGVRDAANATVFVAQVGPVNAGYAFVYDAANDKLVAFWSDNNAAADSALIEVADTTDLSAVTVRLLVIEA